MARVIVFYAIPEFVKERLNNVCISDFLWFFYSTCFIWYLNGRWKAAEQIGLSTGSSSSNQLAHFSILH